MVEFVPFEEAEPRLDWIELTDALIEGHGSAKPEIKDLLLRRGKDTALVRAAWIDQLGFAVKTGTLFPANAGTEAATVNGAMTTFNDRTGELEAIIDFHLITKWKTAGDSLLAALRLARPDTSRILIVGAGTVARSLVEAYSAGFPGASFGIWNRTARNAERLVGAYDRGVDIDVVQDLEEATASADIVTCATGSVNPVLRGEWLKPGTHVDLIGAYRPDMREADDEALRRSRIFVDSRDTTINHIGDLKIPIEEGTIGEADVLADFYDMGDGSFARDSEEEITLFKNGGGAHLDLMTAKYILAAWKRR